MFQNYSDSDQKNLFLLSITPLSEKVPIPFSFHWMENCFIVILYSVTATEYKLKAFSKNVTLPSDQHFQSLLMVKP